MQDSDQQFDSLLNTSDEEIYRQIIATLGESVVAASVRQGIVVRRWVGIDAAEITGYTSEEFHENPRLWFDIVHPIDKERIQSAFERILCVGSATEEYRIFRKDGQMRWLRESCLGGRDSSGKVNRIVGYVNDITSEKGSIEHLVQFRQILDETPSSVAIRDIDGRMVYCNEACARLYGYSSPSEMIGTTFKDITAEDFTKTFEEDYLPQILKGRWSGEATLKRRDGTPVDIMASTNVIRAPSGEPIGIYGILTDITERKKREKELQLYNAAISAATEGIVITNPNGSVHYINPALEAMFGYSLEEFNEIELTALFVNPNVLTDKIMPAVKSGSSWCGEVEMKRKDGRCLYVEAHASPVLNQEGNMIAIMATHTDITHHKEAERALHESESLLRAVQDAIPANVAVINDQGTIIAVNKSWEQFARENGDPALEKTGVGVNYLDVCKRARGAYSEGAKEALAALQAILSGKLDSVDVEYICPSDTKDRWFVMRAAPLKIEGGGAVVAHINISDLKAAENALRKSEEKFRNLVENTNDWFWEIDENGVYTYASPRIMNLLGYTSEEIIGKTPFELMDADEAERVVKIFYPYVFKHEPFTLLANSLRHKDGHRVIVETSGTPIFDYLNRFRGYRGIDRDITERKIAEEALLESEERYRSLVENLNALVFRTSMENRVITVAGRAKEISGYTAEEFMQNPDLWWEVVHPEDRTRLLEGRKEMAKTGQPGSYELRVITPTGEIRWVRNYLTPRFDDDGNLMWFDGIGVDITELVKAEQRQAKHLARMSALADISQMLASSLDPDEIANETARMASTALNGMCGIVSVDPVTSQFSHVSVYSGSPEIAEAANEALDELKLTLYDVYGNETPKPHLDRDFDAMPQKIRNFADKVGFGSGIIAPIYAGDDLIRLLAITRLKGEEPLDEEDLWFLTALSSHVSAALTSAQLYKRQAKVAEVLQTSLIPASPSVPGMDIATCYVPAVGETGVGGDFFDIIYFQDGTLGLVIGDVSGKGVEAAIHTAQAKYMLRGFALQNSDPGFVVTALNRGLCKFTDEWTFVTLAYLLIELEPGTVRYVNAGHEIPIILHNGSHQVTELYTNGPVLGILPEKQYYTEVVPLQKFDLLLCYTDGITDVPCDGERFGYNRLLDVVCKVSVSKSQELLEAISKAVYRFGHGKRPDDQVIVVIRPYE